jgi:two-component system, chemotaxis family, sensor kinase CheA
MTMQDKEMLNDLVVESREHLLEIEPDLLELEQKGDAISSDLINRIFRAIHSIKGGFGFFGIEHVIKLSHAMENVMSKVRDKKLSISPVLTDALLKGVDKLRMMLDDVSHANDVSIDAEVADLSPFLDEVKKPQVLANVPKQEQKVDADTLIRQKHPDVTDELINEVVRNGKLLYQITINSNADLMQKDITPAALFETWEKLGDILDVSVDDSAITGIAGSSNVNLIYSVIFATVLEPDLISAGTGVVDEQIYSFDISLIKARISGVSSVKKTNDSQQTNEAPSAGSVDAATVKQVQDKTQKTEAKIEDALRVKVGLLNNLMNMAGELVLSRNQLMQSIGKKISETVEMDAMYKNLDHQINQSCKSVIEAAIKNPQGVNENMEKQHVRLREAFVQSLSLRLIDIPGLNSIVQNIDMVTSLLQESIMQTRLQPISVVFAKFPRLVRDLAKKLDKEVNLTLVGQDVELDKSIIEQLSDPLTHLIRNSVDHGVETPDIRIKAGKPSQGEVVLRAFHEGGKVHIQIEDDGAGIDRERVRQKALSMALIIPEDAAKMSDREIDAIIMLPGFSTAKIVSDVSGRGVGMDVVKTNIERLGGTVDIESNPGKGTIITMRLPLTLAIISSLIVSAGGRCFAIPQVGIKELVRVRAQDVTKKIDRLKNCEVMRLRGKLLPLVRLDKVLNKTPSFVDPETGKRETDNRQRWSDRRKVLPEDDGKHPDRRQGDRRENLANAIKVIVLKYGDGHFGLVVEDVYDSEEIVVKPLSGYLKSCQCYAGSTIMGDGSVAMILDTNGIANVSGLKFGELEKDIENEKEKFLKESSRKLRELLLFTAGENGNFGVDLSSVARVEKVERTRIDSVGGKEFLKYEDRSMRIIRLSDYLPVSSGMTDGEHAFVIVPKGVKHVIGIVADQVKDVVKIDSELDTNNIRGTGIHGSAIINSALTIIIDVQAIFKSAEPELI